VAPTKRPGLSLSSVGLTLKALTPFHPLNNNFNPKMHYFHRVHHFAKNNVQNHQEHVLIGTMNRAKQLTTMYFLPRHFDASCFDCSDVVAT
jgi:hypothetical protein